ncbi:MAG: BTAD domain-containing putative transcriptional regulator [Deinococcota bacterium]
MAAHGTWLSRREVLAVFYPGEDETSARHRLSQLMYRMKKQPYWQGLESNTHNVRFTGQSDLAAYHDAFAQGDWAASCERYGGPLLADAPTSAWPQFEDWLEQERNELTRSFVDAAMLHSTRLLQSGTVEQAASLLERVLVVDSLNEDALRQYLGIAPKVGQQALALEYFEQFKAQLERDLGTHPLAETTRLAEHLWQDLKQHKKSTAPPAAASGTTTCLARGYVHNTPEILTPFVGRQLELAQLTNLLEQPDTRLLTLLGPGGMGKTRLALALAKQQAANYAQGAVFVPLVDASSVAAVPSVVLRTLGLTADAKEDITTQVLDVLRDKHLLLIFDNAEHVLEGVAFIQKLLDAGDQLDVLVTSRERLNVRGEDLFDVQGLAVPDASEASLDTLGDVDAVRLFVRSARRMDSSFNVSRSNQADVLRLCQQVAGMPLALELAASWLRLMSVTDVAGELAESVKDLDSEYHDLPARHQSLEAVFDHSWQLLSSSEQDLLMQLAIFRGGFQLEAAKAVTGASSRALMRLLNKSFLRRSASGRVSFLEVLRQFAEVELKRQPELYQTSQQRHASYFAERASANVPLIEGSRQQAAVFERMDDDLENYRVALSWATAQQDTALGFQLIYGLGYFWQSRGYLQEGVTNIEALLAMDSSVPVSSLQGRAILHQAILTGDLGELEQAKRLCMQCIDMARNLEDEILLGRALCSLGVQVHLLDEDEDALSLFQEAVTLQRTTHDGYGLVNSLNEFGVGLCRLGRFEEGKAVFEDCLAQAQALDNKQFMAYAFNNLAAVVNMISSDDWAQVRAYDEAALKLKQELGDRRGLAVSYGNLYLASSQENDYAAACSYLAKALQLAYELGKQPSVYAFLFYTLDTAVRYQAWKLAAMLTGVVNSRRLETFTATINPKRFEEILGRSSDALNKHLNDVRLRQLTLKGQTLPIHEVVSQALTWLETQASQDQSKQSSTDRLVVHN